MSTHVRRFAKISVVIVVLAAASQAVQAQNTLVCWGDNGYHQCDIPGPSTGWAVIGAGESHSLAQRDDGTLFCWGNDVDTPCGLWASDRDYLTLSAGYDTGVGLRPDGTVGVFGANNGPPFPNENFIAAAMGMHHKLFLKTDGSIVTDSSPPPAPNTGFVAIAGGAFHSLAIKADGSIVAWGQFCPGPLCTPPAPNTGFTAVAGGSTHSCGLKSDGSVVCFGSNDHGELNVPAPNSGFTAIAAGIFFSVGLKSDGSIVVWGINNAGQLNVPAPNTGFIAISARGSHVLALRGTGCTTDAECDDGVFCDGTESCDGGVCGPGDGNPCSSPLYCSESAEQCVSCLTNAHCDDGVYCNGSEVCSASGACQPGTSPCPGMGCDEALNVCSDGGTEVWMTFSDHVFIPQLNATAFRRDIVARNVTTGKWSLVLDGSDLSFDSFIIDGMARLADGSILLSFTEPVNVFGMTGGPSGALLDDSDIVRFIPTSLGTNTAGSLVFYFDGSDVGLTTNEEDVDAITLTSSGQLVISTVGPVAATGASGANSDLLRFNATSLGAVTAGSFAMHFNGKDVGLAANSSEDVDAAGIRADGRILLSTLGTFSVSGVSGGDEDVIRFTPLQLGSNTSGSYTMFLDLSTLGIATSADVGSVEYKE